MHHLCLCWLLPFTGGGRFLAAVNWSVVNVWIESHFCSGQCACSITNFACQVNLAEAVLLYELANISYHSALFGDQCALLRHWTCALLLPKLHREEFL